MYATDAQIPWFAAAMLLAPGPVLIALAIPLWMRKVPPNWTYGVRLPSTLAEESVWYDINARGGRDLAFMGIGYLALISVSLTFGRTWPWAIRLLGPLLVLVIALIIDTIVLAVAAAKLLRARQSARLLKEEL
jgi:uncharacterized membrane protein